MSKSRARRHGWQRPTNNPQPPRDPQSKAWIRIVDRGCGGYEINTPDMHEYDCQYYDWPCDDCPVLVDSEMKRHQHEMEVAKLHGPPRDDAMYRPFDLKELKIRQKLEPTVATELSPAYFEFLTTLTTE